MTRAGIFAAVFLPAAAVAAAAWPLAAHTPRVEGTAAARPDPTAAPPVVGAAVGQGGCASTGCHGAPAGDVFRTGTGPTTWAASALVWMAADPHRRAYDVLTENHAPTEKLATRMMIALTGAAAPGVPKVKATEDARCLACHTNPALADKTDDHAKVLQAQGVSCEACHGNASGWLQSHTAFSTESRAAGYAAGGMAPLYDLGERAAACAGCHVGAPAGNGYPVRDMNHDMIAAGHPRLNFDFATYQQMLPRHWYERDRTRPGTAADPDFEARAWLVGRVAHAEAACRLTADRAARADPWPEFAESSCVACHHTFNNHFEPAAKDRERYPDPVGRKPGSLPWQPVWPVTRAASLAPLNPGSAGPALDALLAAMQRPRPAATAGASATAAATELTALRRRTAGLDGRAAFAAVGAVLKTTDAISNDGWDRDLTEQVFHGRAALERARLARGEAGDTARFAAAANLLTLPRGTVRFDLPAGGADAVRALLK